MIWGLSLLGVYVAICALLFVLQERLIFVPFAEHELVELPRDDVWLALEDGTRVHAWWLETEGAESAVLFCHGNAGNISHREDSLRFWRERGFSVLIFDYPGYGRSEGSPSQAAVLASSRRAWKWLREEQGLAPERILVFGRSLGGAVATRLVHELLARSEWVKGLVVESSFATLGGVAQSQYPWLPVKLLLRHPFDNRERLKEIDVPSLVVHSPEDDIVDFRFGEEIYRLLPGPKEFLEIEGPHNGGWLLSLAAYRSAVEGWLRTLQ